MTLTLSVFKWARYICWGIGTFGLAYGLPSLIELIFEVNLPEWLYVVLLFAGFFTGGIATPIILGKILFAQCPKCKRPMKLIKYGGKIEKYECVACFEQHEITYPGMKAGN